MILHSLRVANWRNLTAVELSGFSPKITVIYAPNKTGKTSLVEAIRCTLIDYHYNTTRIESKIPWNTNKVPEVSIDFEVEGQRYRLVKRFTRKREGTAELYQLSNSGTPRLLEKDKEVTTKVRQLLGVEKSDVGTPQLLWINQGEVALPRIDDDLDKSLRPVLGTVVTGHDANFRQKLWERMYKWFTSEKNAAANKHKSSSMLMQTKQRIDEKQREIDEINSKFDQIENLLSEVNRIEHEIAQIEADLRAAKSEVDKLTEKDAKLNEKRQKVQEFERVFNERKNQLSELEKVLKKLQEYHDAVQKAQQALREKEEEYDPLQRAVEQANSALQEASQQRGEAENQALKVEPLRGKLEAKRRLVEIQEDAKRLESDLGKARQKESQIESIDEELKKVFVPQQKEIEEIKRLIRRCDELNADLKAAQLSLTIIPNKVGMVRLQIDREQEERVTLKPGRTMTRPVRQRTRLDSQDFGIIEVVRGKEDQSVEDLASERARNEQKLSHLLPPWGVGELDRSEVIPEFTRRTTQRGELEKRLEECQAALNELAPEGTKRLETLIENGGEERRQLLEAHPELRSWQPSRALVEEADHQLKEAEKNQKKSVRTAKEKENQVSTDLERAEKEAQQKRQEISQLKIDLARAEGAYNPYKQRWGSEEALSQSIEVKKQEVTDAQNDFDKNRLTEEEGQIPGQLEAAKRALSKRESRLQYLQRELADLTGQLKGCEGLHSQRVIAEQSLEAAKREHKRIAIEVNAHQVLLKLFEEIRDEHVEKSIAPVRELVDPWLRQLDGIAIPKWLSILIFKSAA